MAAAAAAASSHLRFSPLPNPLSNHRFLHLPSISIPTPKITSLPSLHSSNPNPNLPTPIISLSGSGSGSGSGSSSGGNGGGGGGGGGGNDGSSSADGGSDSVGPIAMFLNGWRLRVSADPQFPFKVLMEELVGVSACVLGDMASRPNFGLNELDFVFSTLVVGSILNFVLMYLLAPTSTSTALASSLPSYIFEPGPFSVSSRFATLITKGATFAAVGFAAGLAGTAISNGLMKLRKKIDPEFETPNKAPPTLLNALTWATHMGVSSNLRYQTLNGVEYVMGKVMPTVGFKVSVVVLRCLNNVLGGMSFVVLARMTGSQKVEEKKVEEVEEKLIGEVPANGGDDEQSSTK